MADSFQLTIGASSKQTLARDLSSTSDTGSIPTITFTFAAGTGINQFNRIFADTRELSAASSENLDMYDFDDALDALGRAFALTKIRAVVIQNTATATDAILTVGNETSAAAWNSPFAGSDTSAITIGPGGVAVLTCPSAAGWAVHATDNHLLKIANAGAAAATYKIVVVGSQA